MTKHVLFFDVLRVVAAIAVIAIHVLAPFRDQLGTIPFDQWLSAITINGISRWAVPVFIMITGALLLSDRRPFETKYYIKRRVGKVFIPFVVWSLFYSYLSGWSLEGYTINKTWDVLHNAWHSATYYHLGFFYYFIPLYLVVPVLKWLMARYGDQCLYPIIGAWLISSVLYLNGMKGIWSHQLWLYSGYLALGYVLYQKVPLNRSLLLTLMAMGMAALVVTVFMVVQRSLGKEAYSVGRWFSYKTINVIAVAAMIFYGIRYVSQHLQAQWKTTKVLSFISAHSLGIYLLHPIFLWPMRSYEWHHAHPLLVIPFWVLVSGALALLFSWCVSRSAKTRWLLP
ncbi:acyltransferase [Marinibactrum halimedae]|uniref:Membrane protein n=1 Tax=Marinibactrum halimedae TaxID=1444977 RepID=A0AA37T804_9GAMM|nr:acyltransferase [Marinibactrum halimedae]MCD9457672.1 acyltransferase [Marinibactrum halimedae]GLS24955.1 membrane protein [Marinibactrum halimedae]